MRWPAESELAASVEDMRASHALMRGNATLKAWFHGGRPGSVPAVPFQSISSKSVISAKTAGWPASENAYPGRVGSRPRPVERR